MITTFNKQNLDALRKEINEALKPIMLKHGLSKLRLESGRYTASTFSSRLEAELGKTTQAAEVQDTILSKRYGFDENVIGKRFMTVHGVFEIVQFNRKAKTMPVIARDLKSSTRMCKFTVDYVKSRLK
jgi:hypothetical protein